MHLIPVNTLSSFSAPGTGAFTTPSAVTGFQNISAALANDFTTEYFAVAVDGSGNRTGDWESGVGRWASGAGTLSRTVVFSSNSNAAVNFTGATQVMCTPIAPPSAMHWYEWDFTSTLSSAFGPFQMQLNNGGNLALAYPTSSMTPGHIGVMRINNTTTVNSGACLYAQLTRLAGSEISRSITYFVTTATTSGMYGFLGGITETGAVTNCAGIRIVNGVADGMVNLDGTTTASATSYTLTTGIWYTFEVSVLTTSLMRCRILNDSGTVLWENTVSATIPSVEFREVYPGWILWNTNTTSGIIANWDYCGFGVNRKLPGRP